MSAFKPLIKWFKANKRDLPWRDIKDPYLIWLSEVILQQTRVEQGLPYYLKFAESYPTVSDLAAAPEKDIMKLWQGLGYYRRATNMHHTAKEVMKQFNGKFPSAYDNLIRLKGIGPYTAAAVSSFAANESRAVLDGNVFRVLSRYFGISEPINSTAGKNIFTTTAEQVLNKQFPAIHNQAMMELGAMVCTPRTPKCEQCVIRDGCFAGTRGEQLQFPVKIKKQAPRNRYFNYLIAQSGDSILIKQRNEEGIWHKLYEPPLIESAHVANATEIINHVLTQQIAGKTKAPLQKLFETKHQLTHQTIHARFWLMKPEKLTAAQAKSLGYVKVSISRIHEFALHRLFDKFLENHNLLG